MKHQIYIYISFFLVAFFALLSIEDPASTGAAIIENENADAKHYAIALDHIATDFLGVESIEFPRGDCGDVARALYTDIAHSSVDTSEGFTTFGPQRVSTLNFVTDRVSRYGTLDMAKGRAVIGDEQSDTFLSINAETIVRVPKEIRTTYFSLDLYGIGARSFYVQRGRFATPSIDCKFTTSQEGLAVCSCNAHSISGIRVAGITGVRAV